MCFVWTSRTGLLRSDCKENTCAACLLAPTLTVSGLMIRITLKHKQVLKSIHLRHMIKFVIISTTTAVSNSADSYAIISAENLEFCILRASCNGVGQLLQNSATTVLLGWPGLRRGRGEAFLEFLIVGGAAGRQVEAGNLSDNLRS